MKLLKIKLEFKLEDLWIGVFWKSHYSFLQSVYNLKTKTWSEKRNWISTDIWVCLVPCVPIHIAIGNRKVL